MGAFRTWDSLPGMLSLYKDAAVLTTKIRCVSAGDFVKAWKTIHVLPAPTVCGKAVVAIL